MSRKTGLILAGIILFFFIIYLIVKSSKPGVSNWQVRYLPGTNEPYDLSLLEKTLSKTYSPSYSYEKIGVKDKFDLIISTDDEDYSYDEDYKFIPSTYVFVGGSLHLRENNYRSLLNFIRAGNSAFIAADTILIYESEKVKNQYFEGEVLQEELDSLFFKTQFNSILSSNKDTATVNLNNDQFRFCQFTPYYYNYQSWSHLNLDKYSNNSEVRKSESLGSINGESNLLMIEYGEGKLLLHSNPILFTNYFLKEKRGFDYVEGVLGQLPEANYLIWDDQSRFVKYGDAKREKGTYPLTIIMDNKSLRAFVYLLLALTFLYIFFNSKRRQRVIPLLPENRNTSVAFSETVGRLYYQKGNNKKLCEKMMKMFRFQIRKKWGIATAKLDDDIIRDISVRSGMTANFIRSIFDEWNRLENFNVVSAEELIKLHQSIELFYSKINKDYGE